MPLVSEFLEELLQTNENLQFTQDSYTGKLDTRQPKHPLFSTAFDLAPKPKLSKTPLKAVMVYTDGSGASHKSVMTWWDPQAQR